MGGDSRTVSAAGEPLAAGGSASPRPASEVTAASRRGHRQRAVPPLDFPHAAQAIQIIRRRKPITAGQGKNKRCSSETLNAITSLAAFRKRSGQPSEVASLIGCLSTDASSYVTGQCLVVDGGSSIAEERA